jgi:hypothetical protein
LTTNTAEAYRGPVVELTHDKPNLTETIGEKMKKKLALRMLVIASVLAASSAAYAAAPQGPGIVTLTNTVGTLWTASIGDTPAMGLFTDVFMLTPAATPGSVAWGSVVNMSFFGLANVNFISADLNGNPLLVGSIPAGPLVWNYSTLLPAPVVGPLILTIHGNNTGGGSYGGDINVTMPVPEPETYGMMLAGLGILAFLARGRKPT